MCPCGGSGFGTPLGSICLTVLAKIWQNQMHRCTFLVTVLFVELDSVLCPCVAGEHEFMVKFPLRVSTTPTAMLEVLLQIGLGLRGLPAAAKKIGGAEAGKKAKKER